MVTFRTAVYRLVTSCGGVGWGAAHPLKDAYNSDTNSSGHPGLAFPNRLSFDSPRSSPRDM
jgi:hypothetical protein